ncbi:MAG: HAD-IA family hydrolase [Nitrospina sp.]|nr:HAD-IA family hydrolase [Nitrospina sp.]MBT3508362.1 HAD-IA family hydrolase [Nitrospina sp.]MBT3874696.1 HAD-IA family hydrolase [Nitrospina sp.]MBT4049430.1 HAD-IA family hydrolase [Nitrospina sp.]MBT4558364.1 HAD-IA family hydrolase [Nitrospina sp.]
MPLTSFKAVFFDVGGTLIHVHPSVGDVYARHARPFGYSGSIQDLNEGFRLQWKKMGGIESLGNQSGAEAEREFWHKLVYEVFLPMGGLDRFEEYFDLIFEAFRDEANWRIYEDVIESGILETLKKRGVVMGVISNWDSRLISTLENIGLGRYFDFILPSAVVGSAKPDKKIFEEALRLSGVAPHEACHIGDEIRTDVEGAQSVGIHPILLDRNNRFDSTETRKITTFLELVEKPG